MIVIGIDDLLYVCVRARVRVRVQFNLSNKGKSKSEKHCLFWKSEHSGKKDVASIAQR